jgi:hypothetical protein
MLGHKVRDFKSLTAICLEDLVPTDNFYRHVERSIDLSFVRELAAEFSSTIGRTSIDPVVFFDTISYDSLDTLIEILKPHIIDPAIKKRDELRLIKAKERTTISGRELKEKKNQGTS